MSIMQVRRHFRPELLNRLDEIVVFDPLSHDQLRKVARLQMKDVALRLAQRGIALAVTDAALDIVLSESYDPVSIGSSSLFSFDFAVNRTVRVIEYHIFDFPGVWCKTNQEMVGEEGCDPPIQDAHTG